MHKLVLIRHGESLWNQENRFTGWQDIDLSEKGRVEAQSAGRALREAGFQFDVAWTSVLKRAIRTLWFVTEELDQMWLPTHKEWRLNERHYGALTGLNKTETALQHGEEQVKIWRRSYDTPPPLMEETDPRLPRLDSRYAKVAPELLPRGESLKDTVVRALPLWESDIAPAVRRGERVLIVAHGNSIRALAKHLERMSPEAIMEVNIPTGLPLVYTLHSDMRVVSKQYIGDPAAVAAAQAAVAAQGAVAPPAPRKG